MMLLLGKRKEVSLGAWVLEDEGRGKTGTGDLLNHATAYSITIGRLIDSTALVLTHSLTHSKKQSNSS